MQIVCMLALHKEQAFVKDELNYQWYVVQWFPSIPLEGYRDIAFPAIRIFVLFR
jgi:hypothetical protein